MTLFRSLYIFSALFLAAQVFTACGQPQAEEDTAVHLEAADETTLRQAIDAYDTAAATKDYEKIVTISMPSKILTVLMTDPNSSQIDPAEAHAAMARAIEQAHSGVEGFDYQYDLSTIDILKTEAGLHYALLPTVTNITFSGYSVRSTGTTLALYDEDQWFLLNPQDEESIGWFRQAYPSLETIDLQPNKVEVVQ